MYQLNRVSFYVLSSSNFKGSNFARKIYMYKTPFGTLDHWYQNFQLPPHSNEIVHSHYNPVKRAPFPFPQFVIRHHVILS